MVCSGKLMDVYPGLCPVPPGDRFQVISDIINGLLDGWIKEAGMGDV